MLEGFSVDDVAAGLRRAHERRLDLDAGNRVKLRERVVSTYGYAAVAARLTELYAGAVGLPALTREGGRPGYTVAVRGSGEKGRPPGR